MKPEFLELCFLANQPPLMKDREWLEQQLRRAYQLLGKDEVDRVFQEELARYVAEHPVRTARVYKIR